MIKKATRIIVRRLAAKLGVLIHEASGDIASATLPEFGNSPENLVIELPRSICNPGQMFLGDDIWLGPGSLLMVIKRYPTPSMMPPGKRDHAQRFTPRIKIGHRVTSTGNLQVSAIEEIIIEDDVMFASNVFLCDALHGYETANVPYKFQDMSRISPILVKRGSWIGQNAVIMPGVVIGECSIVGANSVVTKSLPDRCIAVGAPARIIKKWDEKNQAWEIVRDKQYGEMRGA